MSLEGRLRGVSQLRRFAYVSPALYRLRRFASQASKVWPTILVTHLRRLWRACNDLAGTGASFRSAR